MAPLSCNSATLYFTYRTAVRTTVRSHHHPPGVSRVVTQCLLRTVLCPCPAAAVRTLSSATQITLAWDTRKGGAYLEGRGTKYMSVQIYHVTLLWQINGTLGQGFASLAATRESHRQRLLTALACQVGSVGWTLEVVYLYDVELWHGEFVKSRWSPHCTLGNLSDPLTLAHAWTIRTSSR